MLIYSHTTPEILVASFRTKEQVKNSSYCDLVDDNLPDDLSTLKGDDLIIKEGTNTLNLDIALAIAFNEIRSPSSAIQFGKILIVNGPNIDTRTLLYYTRRINSGPFGSDVSQFFENHFNYITGDYKGNSIDFQQNLGRNFEVVTTDSSNGELYDGLGSESTKPFKITQNSIDQDLINTLKRLLLNCLTAPSNYFTHTGSYGFLANAGQTLNYITSPKTDIYNNIKGVGFDDIETFNKIPTIYQTIATKLNQLTSTTHNKFFQVVNKVNSSIDNARTTTRGNLLTPDTATHKNYSLAQSEVLNKISNHLGDRFRMDDYRRRYNPYNYYEDGGPNAEQAAAPGISGMPVGYKVNKNDALNVSMVGSVREFTTYCTWYCPGGGRTLQEQATEGSMYDRRNRTAYTYESYLAGKAPYVSVAMDSSVLPYGTILNSDSFRNADNTLIPFRVTDTGGAFAGKGYSKMDIATSSIKRATTGPNFNCVWRVAGNGASTNGIPRQYNPNSCIGISDNQLYNLSKSPDAIPASESFNNLGSYINSFNFRFYKGEDFLRPLNNVVNGVRNSAPPKTLWGNIVPTIRVLEALSEKTGKKYNINCSYRSPAYNAALGSTTDGVAKNSTHMRFIAIDFNGNSSDYKILQNMRANGLFAGGIHLYPTFIHVDTRGTNVDW